MIYHHYGFSQRDQTDEVEQMREVGFSMDFEMLENDLLNHQIGNDEVETDRVTSMTNDDDDDVGMDFVMNFLILQLFG